jgi:hypothetical protein
LEMGKKMKMKTKKDANVRAGNWIQDSKKRNDKKC